MDVFLLRADGLYEFEYEVLGELFAYANFVALGREARERLADSMHGSVLE
jgi:hypothetical protein